MKKVILALIMSLILICNIFISNYVKVEATPVVAEAAPEIITEIISLFTGAVAVKAASDDTAFKNAVKDYNSQNVFDWDNVMVNNDITVTQALIDWIKGFFATEGTKMFNVSGYSFPDYSSLEGKKIIYKSGSTIQCLTVTDSTTSINYYTSSDRADICGGTCMNYYIDNNTWKAAWSYRCSYTVGLGLYKTGNVIIISQIPFYKDGTQILTTGEATVPMTGDITFVRDKINSIPVGTKITLAKNPADYADTDFIGVTPATISKVATVSTPAISTSTGLDTNVDINWTPLQIAGNTLTTKFPFSLPWDLKNAFTTLIADSQAPDFSLDLTKTVLKQKITVDMTIFGDLIAVLKGFELLCFDLGLILLTRKLLGGDV